MLDPFENYRRYMVWTFILIIFLLITGVAVGGEKILHSKIKSIEPEKVDGQYCFVKVEIVQEGDTITKREILECADGRKAPDTPGYWELFAQFYYHDVSQAFDSLISAMYQAGTLSTTLPFSDFIL